MKQIAGYYYQVWSNRDDTIHRLLKREIDVHLALIESGLSEPIVAPISEVDIR
jgi:hypothetical protein